MSILDIQKRRVKVRKKIMFLILLSGMGLVTSCTTVRRSFDYERETDYSNFKTFNWLPLSNDENGKSTVKNTMIDKRLKRALKEQLELRGYTFEVGSPDLLIAYHAPVREIKNAVSANHNYVHFGYFHHIHSFHTAFPFCGDYYVDSYDEATLIIDIIDSKENELIWRGWRSVPVYGPSLSEKRIQKAVEKILDNFPP